MPRCIHASIKVIETLNSAPVFVAIISTSTPTTKGMFVMEKRILTNLPTDGLREGVDFRDDPPKKELNMTQLVYNFI